MCNSDKNVNFDKIGNFPKKLMISDQNWCF